ncbi:hypothetical protein Tco_0122693 [Tanacetum coccineum]
MVDDNVGNQFKENAVQNVGHLVGQNAVQNQGTQNVGNENGLSVVPGIANQHGNVNVVAARAEGNSNGINGNRIRCYICQGEDHYASNCTVKPRKQDAAYLQKQMQIAQKEEARIQLTSEEFDFMAAVGACDEAEKVTANCNLENNLQLASTSGNSSIFAKAPVYNSDGHAEETRAYHESLFHNIDAEVEKVNSVNCKLRETNTDLTTELARYKNQEKCFEISQEKYDKLERCYQKSVYQEQCLTKKINALHLSSAKTITTLNEEISNLNKQLTKEKSTVSPLQEEKKRLRSDFKIREDELLDKQIQLENKIKELDNILVKMGQSIQTMHMLSPKPYSSFYHTEQKMALGYQNPFYLKQAQLKQQSLYNGKVLLEKHDPPVVYDSEETLELAQKNKLHDTIYENAKLRAQLFDKVSEQKDTNKGTSVNTQFSKQSILGKPPSSSKPKLYSVTPFPKSMVIPKVGKSNALSKPVTSNSAPSSRESSVVNNERVIAPGIFRINPFKASRSRSPRYVENTKELSGDKGIVLMDGASAGTNPTGRSTRFYLLFISEIIDIEKDGQSAPAPAYPN